MAKQTDYERINRLIIAPMSATWQVKVPEGMVDGYVEDLAGFSDETLAAAFREVRRTCKTPPRIAHFVEACRSVGGAGPTNSDGAAEFLSGLRKRESDARRKAREFTDRFALTQLAQQARAEGWERRLMDFVYEAAWLQAQYIAGIPHPGYSQSSLANLRIDDAERRCREFCESCRRQAQTGTIDVSVPGYLIAEWRHKAA